MLPALDFATGFFIIYKATLVCQYNGQIIFLTLTNDINLLLSVVVDIMGLSCCKNFNGGGSRR